MITTQYLYDCKPDNFKDLPYIEAIQYKHNQAKMLGIKLYNELVANTHNTMESYSSNTALRERLHKVNRAEKHNKILLDELN